MSKIIFAVLTAGFLATSYHASKAQDAPAPAQCKGTATETECLSKQVYQGVPACNWIKERLTASGGSVKAHCRRSNKSIPQGAQLVSKPAQTN